MNDAQRIADAVSPAVTAQSEEIIRFLEERGFKDITVHFSHSSRDGGVLGRKKHHFILCIDAVVPLEDENHLPGTTISLPEK